MNETQVLIVGAGPVGVMMALLLRRLGIDAMVIERRDGPQRAPAAHCINARTFEICRQAGVDMQAIDAAAKSPADAGSVYWVTKLGGEILGQLPYERQNDDVLEYTPTPLRNLSQHRFEPILLAALRDAGGGAPLYGHTWESSRSDDGGITSTVNTEGGSRLKIRSRYLIGADGAGSRVRKASGIAPIGPERLQCFIMIHFDADLRTVVRDCPGVLYWVSDPDCMGTFVAHDIDREWVFMVGYDPATESADSYDATRCEAIVRRALQQPDVGFRIRHISPWTMTCQVAERYRDGRTLLVGDAAHRFPPTGGLGLNTGIQDAHNLAWKLAAVLRGSAPDSLLDTYEGERRPVAQYNADQSLQNALRLFEIPRALGFSEDPAESRANFRAVLQDTARRAELTQAIANQAEHFDMLGLQLGYSYDEGALVPDGSAKPTPANPIRELIPSSRPGARLPHGWITQRSRRLSTLDLIAIDRPTLLVGPDGQSWVDAARTVGLAIVRIGEDVEDPDNWWSNVAMMSSEGALLVRPDQHVAFRGQRADENGPAALVSAIGTVFGKSA